MLKRNGAIAVALALTGALAANPVQAQRGVGIGGAGGPNLGRSLEIALEHQEELGLTGDQLAQLEEMKGIIDQDLNPLADEIKALRESIRAGDADRGEAFRQLQDLQGRFLSASAPLRGRVEEILTVEQHKTLQPLVWQGRPGRAGGRAFQGQGRWGGGVARPIRGSRGGFGLRQGFDGQGRVPALGFRRAPRGSRLGRPRSRMRFFRRGGGVDSLIPPPAPGVLPEGAF
ncbi:hypothetical protein ACFL3S_00685 [Gemmatimonadota bacterium]